MLSKLLRDELHYSSDNKAQGSNQHLGWGGSSETEQEMEDMSQLDCSYNTKQEDIHSFFFNLVSLSVLVALF